jgi:hypothetical protein
VKKLLKIRFMVLVFNEDYELKVRLRTRLFSANRAHSSDIVIARRRADESKDIA